jgi:PAS domain S-box-containing protein
MIRIQKTWHMYLMIGIALLIASGLIGYGFLTGEKLYSVESPLLNTIGEIELEASRIRFWMDDVLAGHEKYEVNGLRWNHIEQSIKYLESLVHGKQILVLDLSDRDNRDITKQIQKLNSILDNWKYILLKFNSQPPGYSQPAHLRVETAGAFSVFPETLFEIRTAVRSTIDKNILRFRLVQAILVGVSFLLTAVAAVTIFRYERERSIAFEKLEEGRKDLEKELVQRKEGEIALAEREQLLRTVFDNSPVALVVTRLSDSRVVDVNESFLASSGYEKAEVLGRTFQEIQIWENQADRDSVLQRLTQDHQVRDLEFRFRMKDGSIRTLLLSANMVEINGEAQILGSALDVTELKRFDKALRESEERLRAVVDNLPVGVWFTDEKGRIVYGNPSAQKIWSGAQYIGPDKFHEYKAWWADTRIALGTDDWAVTRAIRNGETSLNEVLDIECFDGTRKTILNSAVPMHSPKGQIIGAVVLNEDITERKKAEAKSLWLASFPMLNPYPIVEVDLEGHLHYLNPAAEKVFPGLSQQGAGAAWISDWESVTRPFRNGEDKTVVREVFFDGKWYHQSFHWVEDAQRIRIYVLDITGRMQAEETLKTSHDALEAWVDERTQQLRLSNQRLKAEVEERSRTEMSLLQHQLQLRKLSAALAQTEERERRRIATAIHDGIGQTLAATQIKLGAMRSSLAPDEIIEQLDGIRGLLSSAIHETRALTFELSPPVLYEIGLQSALEWMAERLHQKYGLRVTVSGNGSDRPLSIPLRVFFFQAVNELCFNVVKHAGATQIMVFIRGDAEIILLDVVDNGTGFDVSSHRHNSADKMGFGLFSIREQLRHYGGTLTLDTAPGSGTRVALRLPLKIELESQGGVIYNDPNTAGG